MRNDEEGVLLENHDLVEFCRRVPEVGGQASHKLSACRRLVSSQDLTHEVQVIPRYSMQPLHLPLRPARPKTNLS